ncbi:MFS transporter [Novosphingobium resinovorum]|uniref:MFS transporter n=1 Tax=Novosphingobium resinovorum TaxID=158500 RepID=UPI002ED253E6|nr:MFS transporter [Novosphingobium resinovorum]
MPILSGAGPFAYRDFRLFWIARMGSMLSQSSLVIALGWLVYDRARETMDVQAASFQLGMIGLVQFVPMFVLTPLTGWMADRYDRRHMSGWSCLLQLAGALLLAWMVHEGRGSLLVYFLVAALTGVTRAVFRPAINALAPNTVPRAVLPQAVASNAVAGRIGAILGPVVGGYAYAIAPWMAFGLSAALLAVSSAALFAISAIERQMLDRKRHPLRQMADGLSYVLQHKLVLGAISLDLVAVLLGGATALLPVYARDVLHVGPAGLGNLRAAPAVGALGTGLWLSWRPLGGRVGVKMLAAVVIFGAATIGFGLSRSLAISLPCLAVLGAADMVSVYVRQSLVQIATPDAMRGRVGAISSLFVSASNELGEAESGFVAALVGPVAAVVLGGVGSIAAAVLWARWFPSLRNADSFEHVAGEPAAAAPGERGTRLP